MSEYSICLLTGDQFEAPSFVDLFARGVACERVRSLRGRRRQRKHQVARRCVSRDFYFISGIVRI